MVDQLSEEPPAVKLYSSPPPASLRQVVAADRGTTLVAASLLAAANAWAANEKVVKTLFAGAASGIFSRTCTSPLEVVATLQMSGVGFEGGLFAQLAALYAATGPKGFFRGNGANCLKVAPTRAIQFAVYERLKGLILAEQQKRAGAGVEVSLSPYGRLLAGGLAGMVACSFVYPLEKVKTMLTVYPGEFKGILDAFAQAYVAGGVRGFYKGWVPTLVAMFPYVGVEFMIYECFKQWYARVEGVRTGNAPADVKLPTAVHLAIGAAAGAASQTVAHPLDVVRRRLQIQGKNGAPVEFHNMFDGLYKLGASEGLGALYRGLRPACAEKVPSTAITFFAYEFIKGKIGLSTI